MLLWISEINKAFIRCDRCDFEAEAPGPFTPLPLCVALSPTSKETVLHFCTDCILTIRDEIGHILSHKDFVGID